MQKGVTDKYASGNLIVKETSELGAIVLGDCNSAVDKHILKPNKIQTVFTFGQDAVPEKKQDNINYKQYNVADNKHQKISDILDELYEQIEQSRKIGGVLLHCYTGISRSPSIAIAYLMRKKQMTFDNARTLVKKIRGVIHPNDNFHRQLQAYEKQLKRRMQQQRLRRQKQGQRQDIKQVRQQTNMNESESMMVSNVSIMKKKGIRGAVRSAHREASEQNKGVKVEQTSGVQAKSVVIKIQEKQTQKSVGIGKPKYL